jgi:hypothetical protein
MSTREPEAEHITAAYEFFAQKAVELFNDKKQLSPQLVAITLSDKPGWFGDMIFVDPKIINDLQKTGRSKDMLMMMIRLLLKTTGGLVVHVTEAWHVASNSPDVLNGTTEVKDLPDRGEVIMVTVHTAERSFPGLCPISSPERVATFEPLTSGGNFHGRFSMQDRAGHETH